MKIPKLNWKVWDKDNPTNNDDIYVSTYLILVEDDNYDKKPMGTYDNPNHSYHIEYAEPFGTYIEDFWDTEHDLDEGQNLKVLAYCEISSCRLDELVEDNQ